MKKLILSTVLGGVILLGSGLMMPTVQAADVTTGDTNVTCNSSGWRCYTCR